MRVIASSLRKGNIVELDNQLYVVLNAESFHPGKGTPISIVLPQKVVLEVTETEPTTKGQTASSSYKPAVLSNGVRTAVPPFITTGTRIVVMTADGSYVERAKD